MFTAALDAVVVMDSDGYVRDWRPAGLQPMRHWSYAIQWWSFAVLALVLWAVLSVRIPKDSA